MNVCVCVLVRRRFRMDSASILFSLLSNDWAWHLSLANLCKRKSNRKLDPNKWTYKWYSMGQLSSTSAFEVDRFFRFLMCQIDFACSFVPLFFCLFSIFLNFGVRYCWLSNDAVCTFVVCFLLYSKGTAWNFNKHLCWQMATVPAPVPNEANGMCTWN